MSQTTNFKQRFRISVKSVPFVLVGVTILAYGLFAAQQGFHWDDWGFVWMARFGGNERLYLYFSVARPVLAYLYMLTLRLIGPNPFVWQIFALFWRASAAVAMWWALKQIWPEKQRQIFWITLLVLVYPGFSQHSVAIAYGHYSLLFTVFWLSIGLMFVSLRPTKWKWLAGGAALLLSAWSLFSAEYAFGVELLRPFFLWFALVNIPASHSLERSKATSFRTHLKRTAFAYLPYFLLLIFFLVWRVFIFGFHMYQAELFQTPNAGEASILSTLPRVVIDAILTASWRAWVTILDFSGIQNFSKQLLIIYLAILICSFIFLLYFNSRFNEEEKSPVINRFFENPNIPWILLGILGLLSAGIPFYVANLDIKLGFPNDRFLMSFAFGAASLLVGLIGLLPKPDYRAVALSLIVALSMGKQIQYAHAFRDDWEQQKSFFWQLTWRAPQIKPGTLLLSDDSAIRFSVDYSLVGPLNWIYNPDNPSGSVEYAYYFISSRLGGALPDLKPGLPITQDVHFNIFHSSTDDMLVLQYQPPACLHILDPRYDSDIPAPPNSIDITRDFLADGVPVLTARTIQALPLSNPSRIKPDKGVAASPPAFLFGKEIPHDWCYYYQKADLSRQQGDWEKVAALGDEAFAIPFRPKVASEYIPFIEAYLRTNRMDDASELTRSAYKQMPGIAPALCSIWQRVKSDAGNSASNSAMDKVIRSLKYCPAQ
jgi:hypothetical protein